MRRTYELYREDGRQLTITRTGSGPPLLLIHGLSGSRRWWRRNLPAFESRFTVYRVELVGFGHARRQRPLPLSESADVLARWLTHDNLGRAHVLGHSMGGHIAIHLAARHPDLVRRLVLATPTGLLRGQWWRVALRLPRAAAATHLDFVPIVATDALRAGVLNIYRAGRELLRDDVAELLARIRAPTLVVSAGRDVLVPPSLGAQLVARIPNARALLLEDAGHVVMWDEARAFNEAVVQFLEEDDLEGDDSEEADGEEGGLREDHPGQA